MHRLIALALLLVPSLARAEDAWLLRAEKALRWPDAELTAMELAAGDRVAVVYRGADKVRVRKQDLFGWVPADALSPTEPAPEPAPAAAADGLPALPALDFTARIAGGRKPTPAAPPATTP